MCVPLHAQKTLDVGLFYNSTVKHLLVSNDIGRYIMLKDNSEIADTLPSTFNLRVLKSGKKVSVNLDGKDLGSFNKLTLKKIEIESGFKIKSLTHNGHTHKYWDNITIHSNGYKLISINEVALPNYIEGVVESESGGSQSIEYYKIQATISRTYALSHMDRHLNEGFNLCDHVHCQVYHNRSLRNELIPQAVEETHNMVIVDSEINLITAAFYSNCGGQTANSEDVWRQKVSYLRSVKDPFCTSQNNAKWEKSISKQDFIAYIKRKNASSSKSQFNDTTDLNFSQDYRKIYYTGDNFRLMLKHMRTDWNLKSTFFSVEDKGDKVILHGKGFGHGVGLCQEGAMKMAELGYSFLEILRFYYTGAHLIDLEWIEFYRAN